MSQHRGQRCRQNVVIGEHVPFDLETRFVLCVALGLPHRKAEARLADPDTGIDAGDAEDDVPSIRQVLALVERSIIKDLVRFAPEFAPLAAAVFEGETSDPGPDVIGFGEQSG
jgi:hypothetical protein